MEWAYGANVRDKCYGLYVRQVGHKQMLSTLHLLLVGYETHDWCEMISTTKLNVAIPIVIYEATLSIPFVFKVIYCFSNYVIILNPPSPKLCWLLDLQWLTKFVHVIEHMSSWYPILINPHLLIQLQI